MLKAPKSLIDFFHPCVWLLGMHKHPLCMKALGRNRKVILHGGDSKTNMWCSVKKSSSFSFSSVSSPEVSLTRSLCQTNHPAWSLRCCPLGALLHWQPSDLLSAGLILWAVAVTLKLPVKTSATQLFHRMNNIWFSSEKKKQFYHIFRLITSCWFFFVFPIFSFLKVTQFLAYWKWKSYVDRLRVPWSHLGTTLQGKMSKQGPTRLQWTDTCQVFW